MKRLMFGWLLAALALSAMAGNKRHAEVRKTTEISSVLTGVIVVDPQGALKEFSIDKPDLFTPAVIDFANRAASEWRFHPEQRDGNPVSVRNKFDMRLIAKAQEDGTYSIRIAGVNFRAYSEAKPVKGKKGEWLTDPTAVPPDEMAIVKRTRVTYPMGAAMAGADGTVYLVLKITPDGKVAEVVAEQVNLRVVGNEKQMDALRKQFARSAIDGVSKWQMVYPKEGDLAKEPYLVGRVTVDYRLEGKSEKPAYGQWEAYIPGPRTQLPWRDPESESPGYSPDAVASEGDGVRIGGGKGTLKLLAPLGS